MIFKIKKFLKKIVPEKIFYLYHFLWSFFSSLFFGFPSSKIPYVVGITGTKGKTTTVEVLSAICEEAKRKTAFSSSLEFKISQKTFPNNFKMTMPGHGFLQKFLFQAKGAGCQIVILEITSEGILQAREKFIDFKRKVFLNLSPEHLERHKGYQNYKRDKGKFFAGRRDECHIVNLDDKEAEYFLSFRAKKKIGFSLREDNRLKDRVDVFVLAKNYHFSEKGTIFDLEIHPLSLTEREIKTHFLGRFNLYNVLAASSIAFSLGIETRTIKNALKKIFPPAGRLEIVKKDDFSVIIDYAHTPDSLKEALKTVREIFQPDFLVCLTGSAGGGRDKWKRKEIGKIASSLADFVILTNEDPYDEDPKKIIEEIYQGVPFEKREKVIKILEREKAIKKGIEIVKEKKGKRIFAVFGKGGERWMCLENGKKIPWSDKEIVLSNVGH